jgi:hypothetical protein
MKALNFNSMVVLSILLFTVNGCKKDSKPTVDITKCKVISSTNNYGKEVYSYDSYGRITKLENFDLFGASGGTRIFTYGYNSLYISYSNSSHRDTVLLTSSGLYIYYKGSSYFNRCYTNNAGQIDSITLGYSNSTRILFVCKYNSEGNLYALNAYDGYKPWYTKTFTYGTEKNVMNYCPESLFWTGGWGPSSIEDLKFQSKQFYGATISNLLPSSIHFQQFDQNTGAPLGTGSTTNFSYTKDGDGKVTSILEAYTNGTTNSLTLEYSCPQ